MEKKVKISECIEMEVKSGETTENGESSCSQPSRQISIDIRQRNASGERGVTVGCRVGEPDVSSVHESMDLMQIGKSTSLPSWFQSSYTLASIDSSIFRMILENLSKQRYDSLSAAVADNLEDNYAIACEHCREKRCTCRVSQSNSPTDSGQLPSNAKESDIRLSKDNELDNLSLDERIRLQCTREYSRPHGDIYDAHDKFQKDALRAYIGVFVVTVVLVFTWYMLYHYKP